MTQNTQIAIIGTGFSGLGMAIKLKEAGFGDFLSNLFSFSGQ